jgi:hypothetical protein
MFLSAGPTAEVLAFWAAVPGSQPLMGADDGTHVFRAPPELSSHISPNFQHYQHATQTSVLPSRSGVKRGRSVQKT